MEKKNLVLSTLVVIVVIYITSASAAPQLRQRNEKQVQTEDELPAKGATIEEVIVESALYIKPKAPSQVRRVRRSSDSSSHKRVKRQPRRKGAAAAEVGTTAGAGSTQAGVKVGAGPDGATAGADVQLGQLGPVGPNGYTQEQAVSNGAAHSNNGFGGSSAANAQAQGFQTQSANGPAFGASSASTITQSHNLNSNSAGASLSQVYKLPNGQTINFSSTNSFANGPFGNTAGSRGGAISVSG